MNGKIAPEPCSMPVPDDWTGEGSPGYCRCGWMFADHARDDLAAALHCMFLVGFVPVQNDVQAEKLEQYLHLLDNDHASLATRVAIARDLLGTERELVRQRRRLMAARLPWVPVQAAIEHIDAVRRQLAPDDYRPLLLEKPAKGARIGPDGLVWDPKVGAEPHSPPKLPLPKAAP